MGQNQVTGAEVEVQQQEAGATPPGAEQTGVTTQEKVFTQSQLDEILTKRLTKETKKWESKFEQLSEAQKLAQMSEEEKNNYEQQKELKKIQDEKAELERQREAFNQQQYKVEIEKQLKEKGLPTTFSDMMINLSAEEVAQKIGELSTTIQLNITQTVENKIKATANTPLVPENEVALLTLEQMQSMSESEYLKNKELVQASLKALNQ